MNVPFDESLLTDTPKFYKYDPNPPSPLKNNLGIINYSPSAFIQNYTLRKYKKPYELIPLYNGDSNTFSVYMNDSYGNALGYSNSTNKNSVITDQLLPNFNKCTADPNCWGIVIQNTSNTPAKFFGTYTFNYYKKPTTSGPSSPNTDPVELLECDFTNTYYTFIKNVDGRINSKPIDCIPPSVETSTKVSTNSPSEGIDCPPNMASKPESTPNYYYCVSVQEAPPKPSIWSLPSTWIIIGVVVLFLIGIIYYFLTKKPSDGEYLDLSKNIKKKGGYYFLI
jgi:hypothetical protein